MAHLSITFVRGARRVTGSNFLVEATEGGQTTRILIDCGLTQGERFCDSANTETFPYDSASIDAAFFTHAHADHIGLFPKLVKDGFRGRAYATAPTKDLMPIMLEDSVSLIAEEARKCGYEAPYSAQDVARAVELVKTLDYGHPTSIGPITVTLHNAGHIMGSATVLVEAFGKRLLFTGDLGRTPAALVPDSDIPGEVDYLVTESVYGNRTHGSLADSTETLFRTIQHAADLKGVVLIPSFSLERTQIILAALDRGVAEGRVPKIPVFMDSPLAAKVTDVYRAYPDFLRDGVRKKVTSGDDPFSFPGLSVTLEASESGAIDKDPGPKVIIAGAGMSHGGRIRKHERTYLPDKNATLLIVGYQAAGSLGRRLRDGARKVQIDGQWTTVRAKVVVTDGFSAHADQGDLMHFAESVKPKKVFVVLGETESATFLAQRISGFLGIDTVVPREGERYELS